MEKNKKKILEKYNQHHESMVMKFLKKGTKNTIANDSKNLAKAEDSCESDSIRLIVWFYIRKVQMC